MTDLEYTGMGVTPALTKGRGRESAIELGKARYSCARSGPSMTVGT